MIQRLKNFDYIALGAGNRDERPVKVLFVVAPATGTGMRRGANGPEVRLIRSITAWDPHKIKPLLAYSRRGHFASSAAGNNSFYDLDITSPNFLHSLKELKKITRESGARIVHSYGPAGVDFLVVLLARLLGVKSVVTRPVMICHLKTNPMIKTSLRIIDRFTLSNADQVLAISQRGRQILLSQGCPPSRLMTIPNGVDPDHFSPRVNPRQKLLQVPTGSLTIGMFAQMTRVKRHDLLLAALAQALERKKNWVVILAGDGPLRGSLEKMTADLGLTSRVRFLGFVKDPAPVYAACQVVALPSDREGMPMSILEAMAAGKPVVASDVGAVSELLQGTGNRLAPNGAGDFLEALQLFEDPRLRMKAGIRGRLKVLTHYSQDRMIKSLEAIYLDLASADEGSANWLVKPPGKDR